MKRSTTIIYPKAFPAYKYFLGRAMEFAEVSGGRFSRYDLETSRSWLKQRKWQEDPPSRRIEYLIELFPVILDYQKKVEKRDYDLEKDCAEAQRLIVREAVEKACVSTIRMVDHFNRDWEEQGVDWDEALLQGESFDIVASKLLNYRERYSGSPLISRKLATAMFVTDFGLCLGLPKVSCLKDEMLLQIFQEKASQVNLGRSSSEGRCTISSKKNTPGAGPLRCNSKRASSAETAGSNNNKRRKKFFRRDRRNGKEPRSNPRPRSTRGK